MLKFFFSSVIIWRTFLVRWKLWKNVESIFFFHPCAAVNLKKAPCSHDRIEWLWKFFFFLFIYFLFEHGFARGIFHNPEKRIYPLTNQKPLPFAPDFFPCLFPRVRPPPIFILMVAESAEKFSKIDGNRKGDRTFFVVEDKETQSSSFRKWKKKKEGEKRDNAEGYK